MTAINWQAGTGGRTAPTLELTPGSVQAARDANTVSVLVPVVARGPDLAPLFRAYAAPLIDAARSFEFIFIVSPVARPRTRGLAQILAHDREAPVRIIESARLWDEAALLKRGLRAARGGIILTLPPAPQVEPDALQRLVARIDEGIDVAVARRWPRLDPAVNRLQSWVLHRLLGDLCDQRFHDLGCGVRAIRRSVLAEVPIYGEFSRFFPLLAYHHGYSVEEVAATQHKEDQSVRLHGPGVWLQRMLDVLGLVFLLRFTDRPLRFFGPLGLLLATLGAGTMLLLIVDRAQGTPLSTRPLLLFAVLSFALGLQAIAFGLIGEMIVHYNSRDRRIYRVKDVREPRTP